MSILITLAAKLHKNIDIQKLFEKKWQKNINCGELCFLHRS